MILLLLFLQAMGSPYGSTPLRTPVTSFQLQQYYVSPRGCIVWTVGSGLNREGRPTIVAEAVDAECSGGKYVGIDQLSVAGWKNLD